MGGNLLQTGAIVITKWASIIKKYSFITNGQGITKWKKNLLQSGEGNLLQSGSIVIAKWGNFITKVVAKLVYHSSSQTFQ